MPPMGRSRHFGCCGMAVPDYADRSRMYPQFNGPSQQTMNPNPMATYNMANVMPPMARPWVSTASSTTQPPPPYRMDGDDSMRRLAPTPYACQITYWYIRRRTELTPSLCLL